MADLIWIIVCLSITLFGGIIIMLLRVAIAIEDLAKKTTMVSLQELQDIKIKKV